VIRFFFRSKNIKLNSADVSLKRQLSNNFALKPRNLNLYKIALIHKSATSSVANGRKVNNERLEYLGDSIIDSIVAEYLFLKYPNESEGFLTKMRSRIVSRSSLNAIALTIGLDQLVVTQTNNPLAHRHIFGDALEAFVGAIYLDRGFKTTRNWINSFILDRHIDLTTLKETETDYKSRIIELAQKNKLCIQFESEEQATERGQNPSFVAKLTLNDRLLGTGFGSSKKEAEQNAAMVALERIDIFPLPGQQLKPDIISWEN
jgi:ribonuclease-3